MRASAACPTNYDQTLTVAVSDPAAREWLVSDPEGKAWASRNGFPNPIVFYPEGECSADSPHPLLSISAPTEGQTVAGPKLEIRGQAGATREFDRFTLEYALDRDPDHWIEIIPASTTPVATTGKLVEWDLSRFDDGWMTIRLTVYSRQGGKVELKVRFELRKPVPTATPIPTATPTHTATPTPPNTPTPTATPIPTRTPTPTATPIPSQTPTPPPTQVPTPSPTQVPTNTPTNTPIIAPTPSETPIPPDTSTPTP